jgi:hypothetical protein
MLARSPLARLTRWLFTGRRLRGLIITLAWIATLIALFYAAEDWRGQRAWNHYRRQAEAAGVRLDFRAFWPKPVSDAENFAAAPVVKNWFDHPYGVDQDKRWADPFLSARTAIPSSRYRKRVLFGRQFMDLVAWEEAFKALQTSTRVSEILTSNQLDRASRAKAAPGVLKGLQTNETVLADLREASRRPSACFPINYDIEFPQGSVGINLNDFFAVCGRLELKACAELAAGQTDAAFEDVKLLLYLTDAEKSVPFLMTQWSRIHLFPMAVQPIWEGLAERLWSPSQLRELTSRLQQQDFLAACQLGLDAERAATIWTIDCIRKSDNPNQLVPSLQPNESATMLMFGEQLVHAVCWLLPSGWYAREKIAYCERYQSYLSAGFDPSHKKVSPALLQDSKIQGDALYRDYPKTWWPSVLSHRYAAMAMIQPTHFQLFRMFCFMQATADQAALACALEQYRQSHSQFPDILTALVPQFIAQLPKDALTGESYKYHRTLNGSFILYSVGWDEVDEGGVLATNVNDEVDLKNGDWVWEYPSD